MKTLKLTLVAALLIFANVAKADPVLKFSGPFEMPAGGMHKDAMVGVANLYFDAAVLAKVEMNPDKPIKGLKNIPSAEQHSYTRAMENGEEQLGVAFLLVGPPHKWFYVFVGNTADQGKTYTGSYFKVNSPIADIEAVLAAGVTADPAGWKKIGKGSFLAQ